MAASTSLSSLDEAIPASILFFGAWGFSFVDHYAVRGYEEFKGELCGLNEKDGVVTEGLADLYVQ